MKSAYNVIITLELNEDEAKFLKGLVQNPLCDPDTESAYDYEIRKKFWNALNFNKPSKENNGSWMEE